MLPLSPQQYMLYRLNLRWKFKVDPGAPDYPRVERDYRMIEAAL